MRLKYLMVTQRGTNLKVPVLFPEYLHHSSLAPSPDYQVTSAGFATVTMSPMGVAVSVDGKSESLRLESSHQDAKIIVNWLELGFSAVAEQVGVGVRAMRAHDAEAQAAATRSRYPMEHRPVAGRHGRRPASEDLSKFVSPRPSTDAGELFDRILSDTCAAVGVDKRRVISAEESRGEK